VEGLIRVWSFTEGREVLLLAGHEAPVWALAFDPAGESLFSGSSKGVIREWRLSDGSEIGEEESVALATETLPLPEHPGAWQFRKCAICHSLEPDGGGRAGPSLYGVFGREAGTLEGYRYSPALLESQIVWNEETIYRLFDEGPHIVTPGSKMPVQRLRDPEELQVLVQYLKEVTRPE
jgi:cytochrome c